MAEIHTVTPGDKPVLALDIDGVFVVVNQECPTGYRPVPGTTYEFYSPDHAEWIQDFAKDFDPYYLTAHGVHAHRDMSELFEIPEFDWINYRLFPGRTGDLNADRRAALSAYFGDREIAWVEDEARYTDIAWARFRSITHKSTAVIRPNSQEGLQRKHRDQLYTWLGTLATRKS